MGDFFEIPINHKGEDLSFPAEVIILGYAQKIQVDVIGELVMFEPDEERNFRPVLNESQLVKRDKFDIQLLKKIAEVINNARFNIIQTSK